MKMNNSPFTSIKVQTPETNTFDLSHDNKLSLDIGGLYPVATWETLPGDKWTITPEALVRFAPMVYPVMHKIDVFIHFFYVPYRVLWTNFTKFIAGEAVAQPTMTGLSENPWEITAGSLSDYLGLPLTDSMTETLLFYPFTAYHMIFNQYYQDQNNDSTYAGLRAALEAIQQFPSGSTIEPTVEWTSTIRKRAWEHDYFTSVLPTTQKGPSVSIPITLNDLPVEVYEVLGLTSNVPPTVDGNLGNLVGVAYTDDGVNPPEAIKLAGLTDSSGASIEGTINQLRVSYALQRFYELNMRGGTRYNELIMARWGVDIKDDRISRPEYIGGVKNNVVISEVLQTSETGAGSALGEYAGHGSGVLSGNTISYYCPEHGIIMGIMSVRPQTAYFQGIPKMWNRLQTTDYFTPEFAHIGEQAVLNKEIYYDNSLLNLNDEFGYMPMGSEYKYIPSGLHGQFRTTFLPFTLARNFASQPTLNEEFIYVNDDKRIFAVTDPEVQSLYAHVFFNVTAKRKIPFYSTPI
jgi:hypothetical protein